MKKFFEDLLANKERIFAPKMKTFKLLNSEISRFIGLMKALSEKRVQKLHSTHLVFEKISLDFQLGPDSRGKEYFIILIFLEKTLNMEVNNQEYLQNESMKLLLLVIMKMKFYGN